MYLPDNNGFHLDNLMIAERVLSLSLSLSLPLSRLGENTSTRYRLPIHSKPTKPCNRT